MRWERRRLGEVADLQLGKMLDQAKNKGELRPYLANINVRWGAFDLSDLREMKFQVDEIDRFGLRVGDIVMCEGGEPGRCAIWKDQLPQMMFQKALHRIRPTEVLDHRFLFYCLLNRGLSNGFDEYCTGSTIKHLPRQNLAQVEVEVPPLPIQQSIAAILSAYDDLIENNTRRIAILEDMARRLYEEWFVHFRFPGHKEVEFDGELPKGWRRAAIQEAYAGLFDGPHATPAPSASGPVFLGIKNVLESGGLDLSSVRHIAEEDFGQWTKRVQPEAGDLVFTYEATLNRYALVPKGLRCCLGRRMALIRPLPRFRYFLYLTFFSEDWRRIVAERTLSGSTVDRIPLTSFPSFPITLPPMATIEAFDGLASPIFDLVETLRSKNANLRAQRDMLLPKLISGEIGVSRMEELLEAAE